MTDQNGQPKYVRLARQFLREIQKGVKGPYPPGTRIPSENELVKISGFSRHTVVGALELLKRDGWLESQQGLGTIVRARPEVAGERVRRGHAALVRNESAASRLLDVQLIHARQNIADLFGIPTRTQVLSRRLLVEVDGAPAEIAHSFFPRALVEGTQLARIELLPESARQHVEDRKKVRYDTVQEEITVRSSRDDESELLGLGPHSHLLSICMAAHDVTGQVLHVMEVLLPPHDRAHREVYRH